LIFIFQVLEPVGRITEADFRDELADLLVVGGEIEMDLEAFKKRKREDSDLIGRQNLRLEEIPGYFPHFPDTGGIIVDEIKEKKIFAVEEAGGGKRGRRDAFFGRLFHGREGEKVLFEFRQLHLLAVIGEDEVFFLEIRYGFSLLVQDNDLDELDGYSGFVLERLLGPDSFLGDGARLRG
jgi:hypothetical protein